VAHDRRVTPVTLRLGAAGSKMRSVIGRRALGAHLLAALLAVIVAAGPASAQSASPSPASGPGVNGQVTGALAAGSTLTIGIDGTMPGGWHALHLLEASVMSGDQELDRLRFDIEDNKLTVGEHDTLIVGTGATATSEYLQVSGTQVILTTGGANISFEVDARVMKTIPEDARFVLGVVDDFGESAEVTRALAAPESGGISWGTVAALTAAALFAGGFVGNLFASKRRLPPRASVYDAVQRRLETDRAGKGRSA
jgi:hypothetical protein